MTMMMILLLLNNKDLFVNITNLLHRPKYKKQQNLIEGNLEIIKI